MKKVHFTFPVKYKGVKYGAYKPFEVEDSDVELLVKRGAILMEEPKKEEPEKDVLEEPETVQPKKTRSKAKTGRLNA